MPNFINQKGISPSPFNVAGIPILRKRGSILIAKYEQIFFPFLILFSVEISESDVVSRYLSE